MAVSDGIEVFVLAAPGREASKLCRQSLEASDIGTDYVWCEHPAGITPHDHWIETFDRMARSEAPMVILLEDDCIVNRHILRNVRLWSWPDHPDFGAGWLYNPGGYCGGKDVWYQERQVWYGTVAVLYWTADVPYIQSAAERWMEDQHAPHAWDCAVGWALQYLGLKIRAHGPPLVEHQLGPSLLGHEHNWSFSTTRGTFKADWKHGGCVRDAHTRADLREPTATPPARRASLPDIRLARTAPPAPRYSPPPDPPREK